jgi:CubicO group peptidase (beta-lactamase class C family)
MRKLLLAALISLSLSLTPSAQTVAVPSMAVDQVFEKWSSSTPGCAVGVAVAGKPVVLKAYGMADLEHDVRNTPDTIFEAGSVSKQFTVLAVQLLAGEGKLSLDDPVRKYIPELPDYKVPLTIRNMLNHTSGLRDWGSVESIAGWPRTTREYTHGHVLDIVSRQKALNFEPGTAWSYSNTGFNLATIIVSRVSGMPFPEFEKQRIFTPLGMTHTSWRDDHTRIVKGRAMAYALRDGEYHTEMPFENVYGNGGLLTTVGDLLIWNENFVKPRVGSMKLLTEMATAGHFNDGKPLEYGLGLFIEEHRGVHNVYHSGSTAGYRAHLNRFPVPHLSVAVLCNGSDGDATRSANRVSDLYLAGRLTKAETAERPNETRATPPTLSAEQINALTGDYWSDEAETMLTVKGGNDGLELHRRPDNVMKMTALADNKFSASIGTITFISDAGRITGLSVKQDRVWDLRFVKK